MAPCGNNIFSCILTLILCCFFATSKQDSFKEDGVNKNHGPGDIKEAHNEGDIMLGGLFPMHEDGSSVGRHCGALKEDRGIQRMEAMLFAVDLINQDPWLLPNITVGFHILDTCSQDTHALEQTLEFIKSSAVTNNNADKYTCPNGETPIYEPSKPIAIVIGAASSQVSVMVANVLRLFKLPQISYSSTSVELSDKSRFEFFSRVVPPDNYQAQAMVDIVEQLGWQYVSAVADEGNYGESGVETFRNYATKKKICIASFEKIKRNYQDSDFVNLVRRLHDEKNLAARGVIMFVGEDNIAKILKAVKTLEIKGHFAWMASDNWGQKRYPVYENPDAAVGAITLLPKQKTIPAFNEYFLNLTVDKNTRNPWFDQFWQQFFNCNTSDASCISNLITPEAFRQESYVPFVVDAVYAAAHALHSFIRDRCGFIAGSFSSCSLAEKFDGPELMHYIKKVSFRSMQGDLVQLDDRGDRLGSYSIYQYLNPHYKKIGEWGEKLQLDMDTIKQGFGGSIPMSTCAQPCQPGHRRHTPPESCCWFCSLCQSYEIVVNETECVPCDITLIPNANFTACVPKPVQMIEWDSPWAFVPGILAALGIFGTIFILYVFIRFNKTPVIMASGRELCYIMMSGILLSYAMTFVLIAPPHAISCTILRVGFGFSLCICYGAIFTKTNRLSRIFTTNIRKAQRPGCIQPKFQVIMCSGICSVQLLGALVWGIFDPPRTVVAHPDRHTAVLSCHQTTYALIIPLLYNGILIVLCTVYAFKTRKIPENFNETKHIGFTMYSTCIVWSAFVPIYFGTTNFRIQITTLCVCTSISATVPLLCFFAPKVYICLFEPHKNVRPQTMSSLRATQMTFLSQQMRFVRSLPIPMPPMVPPAAPAPDSEIVNSTAVVEKEDVADSKAKALRQRLRRTSSANALQPILSSATIKSKTRSFRERIRRLGGTSKQAAVPCSSGQGKGNWNELKFTRVRDKSDTDMKIHAINEVTKNNKIDKLPSPTLSSTANRSFDHSDHITDRTSFIADHSSFSFDADPASEISVKMILSEIESLPGTML